MIVDLPVELPAVVAEERLAHPNPHACGHCANRATLRLTLVIGADVMVCRPHAARYPRAGAPSATRPEVSTRAAAPTLW